MLNGSNPGSLNILVQGLLSLGAILNVGATNTTTSGTTVTFATPFTTAVLAVLLGTNTSVALFATYQRPTLTDCFLQGWGVDGSQQDVGVSWLAIGF